MAKTVRELREWLATWENQDAPIAFSVWTADDIEATLDNYSTDDYGVTAVNETPAEVWVKIVDEIQNEFEQGWVAEKMSESVRESVINYVLGEFDETS